MQPLLSLPVMRKFIAVGSGSGNVSVGAVLEAAATEVAVSLPAAGVVVAVVGAAAGAQRPTDPLVSARPDPPCRGDVTGRGETCPGGGEPRMPHADGGPSV